MQHTVKETFEERLNLAHRQHLMHIAAAAAEIRRTIPIGDARRAHFYAISNWCWAAYADARREWRRTR